MISNERAVVAKRSDDGEPDTTEIRALASAAGYDVVAELTQTRTADSRFQFGRGKAETLADLVADVEAGAVVFDNEITPQQTHRLGEVLPDGTDVQGRYRLVLDIFDQQAGSREAQLQVELARLRYELPRVQAELRLEREVANERRSRDGLGEREDRRITDIKDRIQRIEKRLAGASSTDDDRRERQAAAGFDRVALAGYTNAGKSTLLRRLADDHDVDQSADHDDLAESATVADRLFETLEPTTRRATLRDRNVLVTDTVGFVRDLPHWLVESFGSTLEEARCADVTVLLLDASDPLEEVLSKLETSLSVLEGAEGAVVPALNKVDLVEDGLAERSRAVEDRVGRPVRLSATAGTGVPALVDRITRVLPTERATLELPNDASTQSLLSWLYDRARVREVDYGPDRVAVDVAGRPSVIERARGRAAVTRDGH